MKKIPFLLLFISFFLFSNLFAQDSLNPKYIVIVKTDVLLPLLGLVADYKAGSLSLELGVKQRHSLQATVLAGTIKNSSVQQDKVRSVITMYKYFLSNQQQYAGFYTGLYLKGRYNHTLIDLRLSTNNYFVEYQQTALYSGLIFGHQHYIQKRLVLDFMAGLGAGGVLNTKIIHSENVVGIDIIEDNIPLDFLLAINLGYKF